MGESRHARTLPGDVSELIRHLIPLTKPACSPDVQPALSSSRSPLYCLIPNQS